MKKIILTFFLLLSAAYVYADSQTWTREEVQSLASMPTYASTTMIDSVTASSTSYFGGSLLSCDNAATSKVLWSTSGKFSCGTDQTSAGGTVTLTSTEDVSDAVIATLTPITGLSFTAAASTNYLIDCYIIASSTPSTTGMKFAWDTPATPTRILTSGFHPTTVALVGQVSQVSDNLPVGATVSVPVAGVENLVILHTMLMNVNAGTMSLGFTPEAATAVIVVTGSICQYRTY